MRKILVVLLIAIAFCIWSAMSCFALQSKRYVVEVTYQDSKIEILNVKSYKRPWLTGGCVYIVPSKEMGESAACSVKSIKIIKK